MALYDVIGNRIYDESVFENATLDFYKHAETGTKYTVIRVFKTKTDGTKQYPFVLCPNGTGPRTQSTLEMNEIRHFPIAINAGGFDIDGQYDQTGERRNGPFGIVIQNSTIAADTDHAYTDALTIDSNGNFGHTPHGTAGVDVTAQSLIDNGIVSAVTSGFGTFIENYEANSLAGAIGGDYRSQRQIIGQFGNEDYVIITSEGRGYDNSPGLNGTEITEICLGLGLKFAYLLDGGGSTQTVIGKKQLNMIYEGSKGRKMPTYIVFNGTDAFKSSL